MIEFIAGAALAFIGAILVFLIGGTVGWYLEEELGMRPWVVWTGVLASSALCWIIVLTVINILT